MRKAIAAGLAALTIGGTVAASAVPAQAQPHGTWGGRGGWGHGYYGGRGYYGGHHHGGGYAGPAIVAGIAGLALGAALADRPHYGYYNGYNGYYGSYGYPAYSYGYAPSYAVCEGGRWVWDPYIGRNVWVRETYPC